MRVGSCHMSVLSTSCPEVGQGRETRTSLWDRKLPVDKWEEGETLAFQQHQITQPASISWELSVAGHRATCFVDKFSEWLPTPPGQVHFPTRFTDEDAEIQRDECIAQLQSPGSSRNLGLSQGQAGCGFLPHWSHPLLGGGTAWGI